MTASKLFNSGSSVHNREMELVHTCQRNANTLTADARRHLCDGFMRRVLLIQTSRIHIEKVATPERKRVLNPYACSELSLHLNSFYIHLRGALDNLAWALHYQFQVLGASDEEHQQTRQRCGLFDSRFLKALESSQPALVRFFDRSRIGFRSSRSFGIRLRTGCRCTRFPV